MSKDWQPVAVRMSPREVLERLAAAEEPDRSDDAQPDQTVTSATGAAESA